MTVGALAAAFEEMVTPVAARRTAEVVPKGMAKCRWAREAAQKLGRLDLRRWLKKHPGSSVQTHALTERSDRGAN